jgi:hypothetical protein
MIRGETSPSREGKYSVVTLMMLRHNIAEYLVTFPAVWPPVR